MSEQTRDRVRLAYSKSGREYDRIRLEDPRGVLLSELDVRLFLEMLPAFDEQWRVFEVGAGTGRFTLPAIERGYRLVASDINETMLNELRAKLDESNWPDRCDVRTEDIFNLSFGDEEFDLVFSFHVIPRFRTLEDQRSAILEVARTIKPGGRFIFNYRNRRSLLYGRIHRGHAATPQQINEILGECGMKIVDMRGKMALNRKLLNRLPLFCGRGIQRFDWRMRNRLPHRAWDVFVTAVKSPDS